MSEEDEYYEHYLIENGYYNTMEKISAMNSKGEFIELLPCPFCGSDFVDKSYDRGMLFECNTCNYSKSFPGYLQSNKSIMQIQHVDKFGEKIPIELDQHPEYYHVNARYDAIIEMNKRAIA